MAVAFVQEFEIGAGDRSTTNYDAVAERLGADSDAPAGLICHTAGFDDEAGVFRILDVWQSQDDAERFMEERLMPIVQELLGDELPERAPQRQYFYELHDVVTP